MSNYRVQIAALFLSRSQTTTLLTDSVGATGVFVRTDCPPRVGELLRIEFVLPPLSNRVILHGIATRIVAPANKHSAPGVEIAFFAKDGTASVLWDQFLAYCRDQHPESVTCPVLLAHDVKDQVRREHPRFAPAVALQASANGAPMEVANMSMGGMFLRTEAELAVGSSLCLTVEDPRTRARMQLDCVVRRRVTGAETGVAVEFKSLSEASRVVLVELLRAADPSAPVLAECKAARSPAVPQRKTTMTGLFAVRPAANVAAA